MTMNKTSALITFTLMAAIAGYAGAADKPSNSSMTEVQTVKKYTPKTGLPKDLRRLNLSETQQKQIKSILEASRQQQNAQDKEAKRAQVKQYKSEREALMKAKVFDENKARQLVTEHYQHRINKELQQLKIQHQIYHVLTPEQQQKWQQQQKRRFQQHHHAAKPR